MMKQSLIYVGLILVLMILPIFFGEYYVNLGSQIMIAAIFAAVLIYSWATVALPPLGTLLI
jgi:branched-chain amino acid transport system permease protein